MLEAEATGGLESVVAGGLAPGTDCRLAFAANSGGLE